MPHRSEKTMRLVCECNFECKLLLHNQLCLPLVLTNHCVCVCVFMAAARLCWRLHSVLSDVNNLCIINA